MFIFKFFAEQKLQVPRNLPCNSAYLLGLEIPHDYDDIELVNSGINEMAFEFLHAYVIRNPSFTEFLLSVDVIDSLIKNFICYFPEKVFFSFFVIRFQ